MDETKFKGISGNLIPRSATFGEEFIEFKYFLPNKIPPMEEFCKDLSIMEKSNQANNAVGELKGLIKNIGNLKLFINSYLRKEAVDSSEIEGTYVSLTDVFLSEAGSKKPEIANPNVKDVVNFVRAIDLSLEKIKAKEIINKDFLNQMHKILLENTRGRDTLVGDFRKQQNWVKSGYSKDILDADFVPPSEEKVEELMQGLFDYIGEKDGFMRLIKAGMIHYYFETVHPYEDGNGRVGRTLITLYLIKSNILDAPIMFMSPYFKKHKETYYNLLMKVRQEGDYSRWIKFFLDGIIETSNNISKKLHKLIDLYNYHKENLAKIGATPLTIEILDKFFERPYYFIPELQKKLGEENYPKIRRSMNYLIKSGIVEEFTESKRNKIFFSSPILKILEENLI